MVITLYTSRVVLNSLGVEDYGVYTAVGGVVSVFAIVTGAMSNAISRFLTYGIGQGDKERLKLIFCTGVNIQIVIALLVFILCEIAGIWFLNNKMNIPTERIVAANWVLHCSLLTFVINLISAPYNACIIAHEHMKAYAYISIFDAALKLTIAYILIICQTDKLIIYSILLLLSSLVVRLLYGLYCRKFFEECRYKVIYDKGLFKEMLGFAGWNLLGNGASVLNTHGVNLLINLFFGVIANSARGIATQVEIAINQLVATFTTAINPQIIKSYANGDKDRVYYLVCKGARFSFFMLMIFAIPLIFETETILKIWLKNIPETATKFTRLALIGALINVLGNSSYTACMATGKIKKYSIVISTIGSLCFFLTLVAYKMGAVVETSYYIFIVIYIVLLFVRLILMKQMLQFQPIVYLKDVFGKIIIPLLLSCIFPLVVNNIFIPSVARAIFSSIGSVIWSVLCISVFGLTKSERTKIITKCKSILLNHNSR